MKMSLPISAAFVSGFAVMSLELLEARLVAPYFGSSVLVWTNIIGVILVALALGAWAGGVVADRWPRPRTVALFLLGAGLWSILLAVGGRLVLMLLLNLPLDIATPLASLVLFAPPAFLLGTVAPAVLRLTVGDVQHSGHTAGLLSAVGTIGSLFGTYVTGYLLLPRYAVGELLVGVGAVLVLSAISLSRRKISLKSSALVVMTGLVSIPSAVVGDRLLPGQSVPSAYGHVAILDFVYREKPAKALIMNSSFQSAARPETPLESVFDYVKTMRIMDEAVVDPKRLLLVGGGGMHIADEFVERHADGQVDAIEIDPAIAEAATKAYGLRDPSRIHILLQDARPALAKLSTDYDVVAVDAFSGDLCVPWQLLTREAVAQYRRVLRPGGVLVANVIMPAQPEGPASKKFESRLDATLRTSFDWTLGISNMNTGNAQATSNVIILAGNGPKPDGERLLKVVQEKYGISQSRLATMPTGGEPWTDDAGTADYESLAMYREARK
ncbi:MAG: fused MFS/spermidine synthase [Patescibacteria group bacterium]